MKKRFETIDIARGIAIILVVMGHYDDARMPESFKVLHDIIYLFHMPLFIFVSGFLCVATMRAEQSYGAFVGRKFKRLMVPYLATSAVVLSIKLIMEAVMPVEHPVTVADYLTMFYLPSAGYYLWFLWSLFWMMCIIPIFKTARSRYVLLALSLPLQAISGYVTDMFCLWQTCYNLIYFAAGAVCYDQMLHRGINTFRPIWRVLSCLIFAALVVGYFYVSGDTLRQAIGFAASFAGIAATLTISHALCFAPAKLRSIIMAVSASSFVIYLFHTTFEGFAKGFIGKMHFLDGGTVLANGGISDFSVRYTLAFIIVVCCGTILPMLLDRYVLRRYAITRFLFAVRANPRDSK